jgi:hypothetical protein
MRCAPPEQARGRLRPYCRVSVSFSLSLDFLSLVVDEVEPLAEGLLLPVLPVADEPLPALPLAPIEPESVVPAEPRVPPAPEVAPPLLDEPPDMPEDPDAPVPPEVLPDMPEVEPDEPVAPEEPLR